MVGKRKLTETAIAALGPGDVFWDTEQPGLGVRCQAKTKSFIVKYRFAGRQRLYTIGTYGKVTPKQARTVAAQVLGDVAKGKDPAAEKIAARKEADADLKTGVRVLSEQFIKRMKNAGDWRPRTAAEVERIFKVYVVPEWKDRPIAGIKRSDITALLDKIEDENGLVMADRTLAWVRRFFSWQEARDDEFVSPVVKGMARVKPKERAGDRVLTDAEIRAIWPACDKVEPRAFGQLVRFLLLTGQRRTQAAHIERKEVSGDLWAVPPEKHKGKVAHDVPLSEPAKTVLASMPKFGPFYFTTDGKRPIGGFSKPKRELDKLSGVKGWRLHDLRRTARTLMARAGVRPEIAERVLGHAVQGIEATYNRHEYLAEKTEALKKLASLIELILSAPAGNVVELKGGAIR